MDQAPAVVLRGTGDDRPHRLFRPAHHKRRQHRDESRLVDQPRRRRDHHRASTGAGPSTWNNTARLGAVKTLPAPHYTRTPTTPGWDLKPNAGKISVVPGRRRARGVCSAVWSRRGVAGWGDGEAPVERRSTKTDVSTGAS